MKSKDVEIHITEILENHACKNLLISQLTDLWRVWEANKNAKSTQEYYRGLSSLKQFNAILERNTDQQELKKKFPRVASRNRVRDNTDTESFLPSVS